MKKRMFKKISGILLSLLMVMTMTPAMAFADIAPDEDGTDSNGIIYPTVNYTDVAPFLAPVEGEAASDSFDSEQTGSASYSAITTIAAAVKAAAIQAYSLDNNITTYADDESEGDTTEGGGTTEPDNGMSISKTATANGDGTYTIQLEAYATGSKVISEVTEDVPTDIVLVLDQSGSMASNNIDTYSFKEYTNKTNSDYYALRHNGSNNPNLYYKLEDESYATVSVSITEGVNYVSIENGRNNSTSNSATSYYANREKLYALVNGEYVKVNVSRERKFDWDSYPYSYYYTYTLENGTVIAANIQGNDTSPTFEGTDDGMLYLASVDESKRIYTYTYTDKEGVTQTIGSSTGATTQPNDFVLYERYISDSKTRLEALKDAVTTFADSVATKAAGKDGARGTDDDVNHRIAMVGFATGEYSNNNDYPTYENTELFIGSTQYNYNANASNYYSAAFQNMNTDEGYNNVIASKNALAARGATYTNLGVAMANQIFKANPVEQGQRRNRVVIVFTDGEPGYSSYDSTVANAAINEGDATKNTYNATVYTVGIFTGADATSAGNQEGTNVEKANWFMQKLSSNNGTPQTPSYYLSAADAAALNNIFQQISEQIESGGSSTTLSEKTVIKDIISPQFTLPEGTTADDIILKTYSCTGLEDNGEYIWKENTDAMGAFASIEDDEVSVTGFDFSANYVGTETAANGNVDYRGNKLVISFKVSPKEGFLGGNNVYTNTSAGVYENSSATEPVMTFERPEVNVPIEDVTVTAEDKNVYLFGDLTADQLKAGANVKVGDVELDLAEENYGLETWQNDYVDITVEIKDKNGNVVSSSLSALRDDTTYTIYVKVAPKKDKMGEGASGTPAVASEGSLTATINVFKPVVTFKDSEVYYGGSAPEYDINNLNGISWKHGQDTADSGGMGDAPIITFAYIPDAGCISDGIITTKQDVPVDVTAKIGDQDITQYVTFNHTNCSDDETLPSDAKFLLHVRTCSLTITKTGGADGEPYVFDVYKDGDPYTSLTISGSDSETIYELPVGTYSVRENTEWSWRYRNSASTIGEDVELSAQTTSGTITVTNQNPFIYWLNGYSSIVKNVCVENNNQ